MKLLSDVIRDATQAGILGMAAVITWIFPDGARSSVCGHAANFTMAMSLPQLRQAVQRTERLFGKSNVPAEPRTIVRNGLRHRYESFVEYLRTYRYRGRCPEIRVSGLENIERALSHDSGAILWCGLSVYGNLIIKMALHQAGLEAVHLSRAGHGFGDTPFANRFLNPVIVKVEANHLAERVVIPARGSRQALQTLACKLRENQIVSITASHTGRRTAEASLLQGRLRLATGPIHLALETGAPVLPVFAFRATHGHFEVSIEEPLSFEQAPQPYQSAVEEFATRMERHLFAHPEQWYALLIAKEQGILRV